jgi:hypothetical protein
MSSGSADEGRKKRVNGLSMEENPKPLSEKVVI